MEIVWNNTQTEIGIPFYYDSLTSEEQTEVAVASGFSLASLILTFATGFLIQFLLGATIEATWLLLGTIQLMSLLPLLSVFLPVNFRQFSKNLAVLHGEPTGFPNVFVYVYENENISTKQFNRYFKFMNFKTNFMLLNAGRKIEIWGALLILMLLSALLFKTIRSHKQRLFKIIKFIDRKLRYGIIIRAITSSYVSLAISACLNVYIVSFDKEDNMFISNVIALLWMILLIYVIMLTFNTIHKTSKLSSIDFQKRFKTFILDLRLDSPLAFHYTSVFLFRRLSYAFVLVWLSSIPALQIITLMGLVIGGMIAYVITIRPRKSTLGMILEITNECLFGAMGGICSIFWWSYMSPTQSKIFGHSLIGIMWATISVNWVNIIIFGVVKYIQKKRVAKIKKKKAVSATFKSSPLKVSKRLKSIKSAVIVPKNMTGRKIVKV